VDAGSTVAFFLAKFTPPPRSAWPTYGLSSVRDVFCVCYLAERVT